MKLPVEAVEGRCGGAPVLTGTRMTTGTLWAFHDQGADLAEIRRNYPHLSEEQVLIAIAFEQGRRFGAAPCDKGHDDLHEQIDELEKELREAREPGFWTLVAIIRSSLEAHYPEDLFDGSSADPGPRFVCALREALKLLPAESALERT